MRVSERGEKAMHAAERKVDALRMQRFKAREQALEAAALAFIAKVERGEVRSRSSYAAFKAALDEGRQDDDGGDAREPGS